MSAFVTSEYASIHRGDHYLSVRDRSYEEARIRVQRFLNPATQTIFSPKAARKRSIWSPRPIFLPVSSRAMSSC